MKQILKNFFVYVKKKIKLDLRNKVFGHFETFRGSNFGIIMTSNALHDAIIAGDLATTKEILCKNGSLISEVLNENEDNALTLSLSSNQTEIAGYLLSCKDVKINHRNKEGKAGLFYCMRQLKEKKGSEEILGLLRQMVIIIGGCNINERLTTSKRDESNETDKKSEDNEVDYPIQFAIKHEQVEALRILFESERPLLDVNVQSTQRRQSVLHLIVHKRALTLFHQFMFMVSTSNGQKPDLDALDCDGHTPLYKAVLLCQYAMANALCQFGANVNAFCGTLKQTIAHLIFQSWPDSYHSKYILPSLCFVVVVFFFVTIVIYWI
ncbi:hypothetical protein RFI_12422 [Reticulomyxa filosa]|uniref:Uncharacterized protein n=1 Tax=Reticulomyxa filosa TaxID=46433 RepID=X6NEH9_RETFI|nr:hypothetical protein RFI_12422 [Reticulomyxa filosa]|eukprot:ETO24735.1 hypothetical protein RFI_12422 [Reticulomyxa filosa]